MTILESKVQHVSSVGGNGHRTIFLEKYWSWVHGSRQTSVGESFSSSCFTSFIASSSSSLLLIVNFTNSYPHKVYCLHQNDLVPTNPPIKSDIERRSLTLSWTNYEICEQISTKFGDFGSILASNLATKEWFLNYIQVTRI